MKILKINIPDDRGKLYNLIRYPAGEIQVRLTPEGLATAQHSESYVISANPIPDIIELAQLKDAIDSVKKFFNPTLELMYLPYARADRRFLPSGDTFGLKVFANFLNSLNFSTVYTFDAHNKDVAELHISNLISLDPIHHYNQIGPIIRDMGGRDGMVLIAPDKGAQSRYDLAFFDLPVLVGEKIRHPETGKLAGFNIGTEIHRYRRALIVDDVCDGGETFLGLGEVIKKMNPEITLGLYVSHGIFSQGMEKLDAMFFPYIYISDYSFRSKHDSYFGSKV